MLVALRRMNLPKVIPRKAGYLYFLFLPTISLFDQSFPMQDERGCIRPKGNSVTNPEWETFSAINSLTALGKNSIRSIQLALILHSDGNVMRVGTKMDFRKG